MYKELADKTYNEIFSHNLHVISKDLEALKSLVLKNQKLLLNNTQKSLFVYELADKIKTEKINRAIEQERKFGQVIMSSFENIEALYFWLKNLEEEGDVRKDIDKKIWLHDKMLLEELCIKLISLKLIDEAHRDEFMSLLLNDNSTQKMVWYGSNTLLIYFFNQLEDNQFIQIGSGNKFLEANFLTSKGKLLVNIKQAKSNIKNSKTSKPKNFNIIDELLNALPKKA